MVSFNEVQAQLITLNGSFRYIGIAELQQLACALQPGELIMDCLKGWHGGTLSVLCATDRRMVIVDKNTTKSRCQEIHYSSIEEIHHLAKVWTSTILVTTSGDKYEFLSWHVKRLKTLHVFIKRHMEYVKEQSEAAQELVDNVRFQSNIRPARTSRNWAVFAQRIGATSVK